MIQTLSTTESTKISSAEANRLIAVAQDVPCQVITGEDGTERVVYGKTAASEDALERLTTAYLPVINRAARSSNTMDRDEAFAVCAAEFIAAVRRYDLTSDVPFPATILQVLRVAVYDGDRESNTIVVKETVALLYWRLMRKHNGDVHAAYLECRDTANGFGPATFLAVHHAFGPVDSLDVTVGDDDHSHRVSEGGASGNSRHEAHIADKSPNPEEIAVAADLVSWLFGLVTDRQEQILRLRFGFCDQATETSLLPHGLHLGEVLSDVQVSEVTGIGRATVQREKAKALQTMRTALQNLVDEA